MLSGRAIPLRLNAANVFSECAREERHDDSGDEHDRGEDEQPGHQAALLRSRLCRTPCQESISQILAGVDPSASI